MKIREFMATVLVSFIGKGNFDQQGKRTYRTANYKFATDEGYNEALFENSSLFGVSLLKRLQACGRSVDRWLVMGSELSMWDALLESVEKAKQNDLENNYLQIGEAIEQASTTQSLLDEWQNELNKFASTKIICRLVGAGDSFESQEQIWKALAETVKEGDKIVLDVTNGLRHQPVIASFMVMLLRWLRGVKKVDLYYGAFELTVTENNKNVCPVLRLPLCNELLEATEAVSTFQQTGNFIKLGKSLNLSETDVEKVAFSDEVNKPDKGTATRLRNEIKNNADKLSSVQKTLEPLLDTALNWQGETTLAHVYKRKATFAFEHKQYFQAIALLWEAILVAGCQKFSISNPTSFRSRRDAERQIEQHLTDDNDKRTLQKIDYLRNAIMHGTEVETSRVENEVKGALRTSDNFKAVFKEGERLLGYLLG